MRNDQIITLLTTIKTLAMLPYPFTENTNDVDDVLVFALGNIGGIAQKAIRDYQIREEEK